MPETDRGLQAILAQPMRHRAVTSCRLLALACAVLVLAPRLAAAAEPSLAIDFDGDGRHDRVTLDHRQPSVVHVWLSASDTTHVLSSRYPLQRIAATDLDGDHRPELIVRDGGSRIQIWTHRRTGFFKYRPRRALPNQLTTPARRHVDDSNGEPAGVINGAAFSMSALMRASPRVPTLDACGVRRSDRHARLCRTAAAVDPFAPRPPPAHLSL